MQLHWFRAFLFPVCLQLHSSCVRCTQQPTEANPFDISIATQPKRTMVKAPDQMQALPAAVSAGAAPAAAHDVHHRGSIPAADGAVNSIESTNRGRNLQQSSKYPYSLSRGNLDAHATAQSTPPRKISEQHEHPDSNEAYPAHQAALRRLNGTASANKHNIAPSESGSTTSTQPVLVRSYPNPSPTTTSTKAAEMKQKQRPNANTTSYDLPPLESFSFQDILASIDPEIRASIDTIAEICGRSKMSLADEYDSHLPPQGPLPLSPSRDHQSHAAEMAAISRLEPVEENSRPGQAQRHSFALANTSSERAPLSLSSTPIAATSNINSHPRSPPTSTPASTSQLSASYSEQILAWLRGSTSRTDNLPNRDSNAADALQRILGDNKNSMASL